MFTEMPVLRYWYFVLIHVVMFVESMLVIGRLRLDFKEVMRVKLKGPHILFMGQMALLTIVAVV